MVVKMFVDSKRVRVSQSCMDSGMISTAQSEEDLGTRCWGLEVDGFFPQAGGVGDVFEGFS